MIYILGSVLIALVLCTFIGPVLRKRSNMVSHTESAQAIMLDQLEEVDRDIVRGLISATDGRSAQLEIQRRIIGVVKEQGTSAAAEGAGAWAMIGAGVFVPAAALVLYLAIGSPSTPSVVFSERGEERAAIADRGIQTQQLFLKLEAAEDGGSTKDWLVLAAAYMRADEYERAAEAFSRVLNRKDVTHAEFTGFAEAVILSENGLVTPIAETALDTSLQMAPGNIKGTFYKSFALDQAGNVAAAYALLTSRLGTAVGQPPWTRAFLERANHYGKKLGKAPMTLSGNAPALPDPTADDVAAASEMSTEERADFIAAMVERLATRLEDQPEDFDGWLQLAHAYSVLGSETQAFTAYRKAEGLAGAVSETVGDDADGRKAQLSATADAISENIGTVQFGADRYVRVELFNRRLTGEMELSFTIENGWHINAHVPLDDYLIATTLSVDGASVQVHYPDAVVKSLSFNDASLALYERDFSLYATFPQNLNNGPTKARLTFQACSDELCLPPEDMVFVLW